MRAIVRSKRKKKIIYERGSSTENSCIPKKSATFHNKINTTIFHDILKAILGAYSMAYHRKKRLTRTLIQKNILYKRIPIYQSCTSDKYTRKTGNKIPIPPKPSKCRNITTPVRRYGIRKRIKMFSRFIPVLVSALAKRETNMYHSIVWSSESIWIVS